MRAPTAPPRPAQVRQVSSPRIQAATAQIARQAVSARRRRRAFAIVAVASSFIGAAMFWLASAGNIGSTISPPSGAISGRVAEWTALNSAATRTSGAATLQHGVTLGRMMIAADYVNSIRINIAWMNAVDANQVLNNPNAQISVGVYRPVHTGNCTSSETAPTHVTVTDTAVDGTHDNFCTAVDGTAASSPPTADGRLLLSRNLITGYIRPAVAATSNACTASGTTSWCQPPNISTSLNAGDESNQRVAYVIVSILTPGGNPQGQVNTASDLRFHVSVKRMARSG